MSFGENLQTIRKKNQLSQEGLAEILGVSRQAVSKWELGEGYPEVDKLLVLSKNKIKQRPSASVLLYIYHCVIYRTSSCSRAQSASSDPFSSHSAISPSQNLSPRTSQVMRVRTSSLVSCPIGLPFIFSIFSP